MSVDVLIIGGGLIGLSCAWRSAEAGLDVTVVDPEPARGASHVAAGMLAPVTEVVYGEEDRLAFNIAAARRWPQFVADLREATGRDVGYRATGTLLVGAHPDDATALADLHAFHTELGLEVAWLRGREARVREPMLSPRVRVGLHAAEDHRVEPRAVLAALLDACDASGVELRRASVDRVETDGARVSAVSSSDGQVLQAGEVVLAAGAWSQTIDGLPDAARPPVRPLKGQVLHLRDPDGQPVLATTVRGLVDHRSIYLLPRDDGRLVVGSTQEERGFDTTVTAGGTRELLDDAATVVPGIDELELTEAVAGLRPTTPDNTPAIGRHHLDNLVVATGHHRNGVLLTPITAEAVTALLAGGRPDPLLDVAAPDRPALAVSHGRREDTSPALEALITANRTTGGR